MGMGQYLLIPFLVGWTSIYQLFWCSPGVQGFDPSPSKKSVLRNSEMFSTTGKFQVNLRNFPPNFPSCSWVNHLLHWYTQALNWNITLFLGPKLIKGPTLEILHCRLWLPKDNPPVNIAIDVEKSPWNVDSDHSLNAIYHRFSTSVLVLAKSLKTILVKSHDVIIFLVKLWFSHIFPVKSHENPVKISMPPLPEGLPTTWVEVAIPLPGSWSVWLLRECGFHIFASFCMYNHPFVFIYICIYIYMYIYIYVYIYICIYIYIYILYGCIITSDIWMYLF